MEINGINNKFRWLYLTGFFIILALPILIIPPYLFPADWGKSIVFRSIMAILLFLFAYQFIFRKNKTECFLKKLDCGMSIKFAYEDAKNYK